MPPERITPKTPAEILAALDSGEITRGDKGEETLISPEGTQVTFYRATGAIYFTDNGESVEAAITSSGRVDQIRIAEAVTGKTVFDRNRERLLKERVETWAQAGFFDSDI